MSGLFSGINLGADAAKEALGGFVGDETANSVVDGAKTVLAVFF